MVGIDKELHPYFTPVLNSQRANFLDQKPASESLLRIRTLSGKLNCHYALRRDIHIITPTLVDSLNIATTRRGTRAGFPIIVGNPFKNVEPVTVFEKPEGKGGFSSEKNEAKERTF
jgi:hypothetical protein